MASEETAQEKTEEATPKRLDDARKKADVARSRELATAAVLLGGLAGMVVFGPGGVHAYEGLARRQWRIRREDVFDDAAILNGLYEPLVDALVILAPFLALMFVAAIAGTVLLGGWVFSGKALKPDFARMNPVKGLGRMVGPKALGELAKGLAKVVLLGGIGWTVLETRLDDYVALGRRPLELAVPDAFALVFGMLLALIVAIAAIAFLDVPWQRFQHAKKLRMTRQQVREESKETNGNPELKAKVRALQQSVSQRRMLRDVPDADVVVVNPTHYAVALRYVPEESAPVVLASGVDHMAMRIRDIAREHRVATLEAPPLARALYRHAPVGAVIPPGLYVAVAQVLAHVYRARAPGARYESPPTDLPIPPELGDPAPDAGTDSGPDTDPDRESRR